MHGSSPIVADPGSLAQGFRISLGGGPVQQASTARMRCASAIRSWAAADGIVFPDWAFTSRTKAPSVPQVSATLPEARYDLASATLAARLVPGPTPFTARAR